MKVLVRIWIGAASFAALVSFWIWGRFTVDDAFITWRYGRNLVTEGIWSYNPSTFDITQAYTNPVFAYLSIIPAFATIDVVLFFKLVTFGTLVTLLAWLWFTAERNRWFLPAFAALPATIIHTASGLETIMFVAILTAVFIVLTEDRHTVATVLAAVLLLVRPEAWVLLGVVPLHIALAGITQTGGPSRSLWRWREFAVTAKSARSAIISFIALASVLALHLAWHYNQFGYPLPNTFYVKSGSFLSPLHLVWFSVLASPVLVLFLNGVRRAGLSVALFLVPVIIQYSISSLTMNYAERFAFHIYAPVALLMIYSTSRLTGRTILLSIHSEGASRPSQGYFKTSFGTRELAVVLILGVSALMFVRTTPSELLQIANYYPRALTSHAELGKVLGKAADDGHLSAFSFGDAGMTAFHARIPALDNIGLGSSAVAHNGVTPELLTEYGVEVAVFLSNEGGIRLRDHSQSIIFDWTIANVFQEQCDVIWTPGYALKVFAKEPIDGLAELCSTSNVVNNVSNRAFFANHASIPPWSFWRE